MGVGGGGGKLGWLQCCGPFAKACSDVQVNIWHSVL